MVDDACDSSLGGLLDDVRAFIQTQPATTLAGVAYMNNNTLSIAQDLTNDHNKASKALRIPLGNPGAHGSPYLSLAVPFSSTGSSFVMGMVRKTKLPCVTRFLPVARLVPLSCPATGALYKAWNCGTEKRIGEPARPSAYTDSDRTE